MECKTPAALSDQEKLAITANQVQLHSILHAHKCQQQSCTFNCKATKTILRHLEACREENCSVPLCQTSRAIIRHWKYCVSDICPVCLPFKNNNSEEFNRCTDPAEADINNLVKSCDDLTLESTSISGLNKTPTRLSLQGQLVASINSGEMASLNDLSSLAKDITNLSPGTKNWHFSVTNDERKHIITTLMQGINLSINKGLMAVNNILNTATEIETELFEKADSRVDYYYLIATETYKMLQMKY